MNNRDLLRKLQSDMMVASEDSYYKSMESYRSIYESNEISKSITESLTNNGANIVTDSYSKVDDTHILIIENEDSLIRVKVKDSDKDRYIVGPGACFYKETDKSSIDKDTLIKLIKLFDTNVDKITVKDDGTVCIKTIICINKNNGYGNIEPEYLDKNCPNYVLDNKSDKKYVFKQQDKSCVDEMKRSELDDDVFGIPEERKYPMPDKKHVYSAIKLFGHVEPKYEKELANNIKKRMKQYGISKDEVGEKNKLKKYL